MGRRLWFDVERRYKTMARGKDNNQWGCGLMWKDDIRQSGAV